MVQAFSYIRFSSKQQELGASLKRQTELRDNYLAKRPELTLNQQTYEDLGVSAFRGKNAAEGNLRMFLDAIKKGVIPKGSLLLIESLDRLSRADVLDALELFLSIVNAGVSIVTLLDEREYSRSSIKQNWSELIISIAQMARAAEESTTKGSRIRDAWARNRTAARSGHLVSRMAPAWLTMSEDRKRWIVDREKAKVVKRVFAMAAEGNGCPTIARVLNEEGIVTATGKAWSFGTVHAVLCNRAVMGEYGTRQKGLDPIPNYFPVIVDPTRFAIVQTTMKKRRWIGGRSRESVQNIFAGISYCGECDNRMRVVQSTAKTKDRELRTYVQCMLANDHAGCDQGRFPYLAAEQLILHHLADQLSNMIARVDVNEVDPVAVQNLERAELARRMDNLIELAELGTPKIGARIAALQKQIDELDAVDEVNPAASLQAMRDAADLFETLVGNEPIRDRDLRLKLQAAARKVIDGVYYRIDGQRYTVGLKYVDDLKRTKVEYFNVKRQYQRR